MSMPLPLPWNVVAMLPAPLSKDWYQQRIDKGESWCNILKEEALVRHPLEEKKITNEYWKYWYNIVKIQKAWMKYRDTKDSCAICMNIIGKDCCTTECGHKFCTGCLLQSTQINGSCPLCRKELVELKTTKDVDEDIDDEYWSGYSDGRNEASEELHAQMREEIDVATQQAYDDGIIAGRSIADEEIRKLREQIKELKNQDVKKPIRPPNPFVYFKSHPDNQKLIEEAAKVINLETNRPLGKVKASAMLWSRLSDERKQEWKQMSIANFSVGVRT